MPDSIGELKSKVGDKCVTVKNLRIEAGKVAEFAEAIGDDDPIYRDGDVAEQRGFERIPAPLTFTRTAYFSRYRPDGVDNLTLGFDLGFDENRTIHGEQAYEFERTPTVGDLLTGTTTLSDVFQRDRADDSTMTFAVLETEYRDQDESTVMTVESTRIEMPPAADKEKGDENRD